jgi:hypothetical protein
MHHGIPLKECVNPFRQMISQINPLLFPMIKNELKILLDACINIPLRYSEWVANLVLVRK